MADDFISKIQQLSNEKSSDARVYYEVFRIRANCLSWRLKAIKLSGILVPLSFGAVAIGFGVNWNHIEAVLFICAILTSVQFIASIIVDNLGWADDLAYSYEAMKELGTLADEFTQLSAKGHDNGGVYNHMYEMIRMRYDARLGMNVKYNISREEIDKAKESLKVKS